MKIKKKEVRNGQNKKGLMLNLNWKSEINQRTCLPTYIEKKLNLFLKCKRFRSDKKLSLKILRNFDNYVHRFVREFLRAASKIGLSF